jgi:hypothetical protein
MCLKNIRRVPQKHGDNGKSPQTVECGKMTSGYRSSLHIRLNRRTFHFSGAINALVRIVYAQFEIGVCLLEPMQGLQIAVPVSTDTVEI